MKCTCSLSGNISCLFTDFIKQMWRNYRCKRNRCLAIGGCKEGRDARPWISNFFWFHAVFRKFLANFCVGALPRVGTPPRGNPGFAPVWRLIMTSHDSRPANWRVTKHFFTKTATICKSTGTIRQSSQRLETSSKSMRKLWSSIQFHLC